MTKPIVIAVDGTAASGKGTLAKKLARHFGFAHLDSGALYRLTALAVLEAKGDPKSEADAVKGARAIDLGRAGDPAIRTDVVGKAASDVAAIPAVRAALLDFQREFSGPPAGRHADGAVMDGRDIGTVICPRCRGQTVSSTRRPQPRAHRRWLELQSLGHPPCRARGAGRNQLPATPPTAVAAHLPAEAGPGRRLARYHQFGYRRGVRGSPRFGTTQGRGGAQGLATGVKETRRPIRAGPRTSSTIQTAPCGPCPLGSPPAKAVRHDTFEQGIRMARAAPATHPNPSPPPAAKISRPCSKRASRPTRPRRAPSSKASIVAIENDFAMVDVGLKTEGRVALQGIRDAGHARRTCKVGDEVEVYLERVENALGEAVLSRDKARREESWIKLEKAFNEQTRVTGVIFGRVKGGFTVDLDGAVAFLPGSQVDVRPMRDVGPLMNQPQLFQILKMDRRRGNIVVSRRAVLEERRAEERTSLVASLQEKQIVEGVVKNITDYGAFVDLGGVDGLLHVTDIAWRRVSHPTEVLSVGQTVTVQIIKINHDTQRISLGMKQLQTDPWEGVAAKYPVGVQLQGQGHQRHRLRRLCGAGAGRRRSGPCLAK